MPPEETPPSQKKEDMTPERAREFIKHVTEQQPIEVSANISPSQMRHLASRAFDAASDPKIDRGAFDTKLFELYPPPVEENVQFSKDSTDTFVDAAPPQRRLDLGNPGPERSAQLANAFFENPETVPFRIKDSVLEKRAVIAKALMNVFLHTEEFAYVSQTPILVSALEKADKQYPLGTIN